MMLFAKAISFLLGPSFALFPVPYILVSKITNDPGYVVKWTAISYSFVVAIAILVQLGVILGIFTNFDVSKREQRPALFMLLGLGMFFYLISLFILNGPQILFFAIFTLFFGLMGLALVTKWTKASIHVAVLALVMMLVGFVYQGYYFLLFLLVPLLIWARVKTKGHTLSEALWGGVLGTLFAIAVYLIGGYFELIY